MGYISVRVIEEILKAPQPKQDNLLKVVAEFTLESLPLTDEVKALADRYIKEKIIPEKELNDAVHIAVASINHLDVIVSWNFEHMVKFKTRREVNGINTLTGYSPIEICTPQEVL